MARALSVLTCRSRPCGDSALGFGDQRRRDAAAPGFRRHHDLVEIEGARIDGDEADQLSVGFGHRDGRGRHQLVAPAFTPPVEPRGEVDLRIGELPGAAPQLDRRVLVGGHIGAQCERRARHRVPGARGRRWSAFRSSRTVVRSGFIGFAHGLFRRTGSHLFRNGRRRHRSVSFSSMRRLRLIGLFGLLRRRSAGIRRSRRRPAAAATRPC